MNILGDKKGQTSPMTVKWLSVALFLLSVAILFISVSKIGTEYIEWAYLITFLIILIMILLSNKFFEKLFLVVLFLVVLLNLGSNIYLTAISSVVVETYPWASAVIILLVSIMIIIWHRGATGSFRQSVMRP